MCVCSSSWGLYICNLVLGKRVIPPKRTMIIKEAEFFADLLPSVKMGRLPTHGNELSRLFGGKTKYPKCYLVESIQYP